MTILALLLSLATQAPDSSAVQIVARDMMSQIDQPRQAVARTPAEWSALWKQHSGEAAAAKVDLGARTIVAVFLGTRLSAGFAVDITGTRETGGVLTVLWSERRPSRDEVTAQILTSPMAIASIPRFAGEIRFEKAEK